MRHDHPFSRRNKMAERVVGGRRMGVGGDKERGAEQNLKKVWRICNIEGSSKK